VPIMQRGVAALSDRMPKLLSPRAHAIADYTTIGGLVLIGAMLWRRKKHAAIAAFTCAGAETANVLLTNFPGGLARTISFSTHGKIDMGLAATCSSMPDFMGFQDDPHAKFFRIMGLSITTIAALTDFQQLSAPIPRSRRAA
jgi:hypothetical protein